MDTDEDDDNPPIPLHRRPLGPAWRRIYQPNPKHGRFDRGDFAREPVNGQDALDWSVRVKGASVVRVGIDYADGAFVVLRRHTRSPVDERAWEEIFHGYVVGWHKLEQDQRNALMKAGMADHRGRIL